MVIAPAVGRQNAAGAEGLHRVSVILLRCGGLSGSKPRAMLSVAARR
jgi:hypothetical protein